MKALSRNDTAAFLADHDGFCIVTHRRPDGDTLGSASLLCQGLRKLGKRAHVLENPETTPRYTFLCENLTKAAPEETDIFLLVDVAAPSMLPGTFQLPEDRLCLRIDHHASADPFTTFELVEPKSAACAEIVYHVLTAMGVVLDEPMADALYTAISTDTGCFRYSNTTADTFQVAAVCAQHSKHLFALNQLLFQTHSLGRLRLQGWLVEHGIFLKEGRAVICPLPKKIEQELGLCEDDLENISGFPRTIAGVQIAATLREESDGRIKLSVRTDPEYDAAAICSIFGGGGHKGAAGASVHSTMEDTVAALRKALETVLP